MNTRFSHNAAKVGGEGLEISAATDLIPTTYSAALKRRFDVDVDTTTSPSATFVPEYYEPNYAYPLLIWLHDEGGSERDLLRIMPEISNRNYFGLSARGPLEARTDQPGYRWSHLIDDAIAIENELYEHVGRLRRMYHIHSERVFIGGCGDGATAAMRAGLRRPEWFAGVAAIGGHMPEMDKPLANYRQLQGKRILLAGGHRDDATQRTHTRELGTLLHTAGMTVCSRTYETAKAAHRSALRDIDRWMMQECYRTVTVE
jgi:phospholipase/carboxylesterase